MFDSNKWARHASSHDGFDVGPDMSGPALPKSAGRLTRRQAAKITYDEGTTAWTADGSALSVLLLSTAVAT